MLLTAIDIILRGFTVGVLSSITVGPVAVLCIQTCLMQTICSCGFAFFDLAVSPCFALVWFW